VKDHTELPTCILLYLSRTSVGGVFLSPKLLCWPHTHSTFIFIIYFRKHGVCHYYHYSGRGAEDYLSRPGYSLTYTRSTTHIQITHITPITHHHLPTYPDLTLYTYIHTLRSISIGGLEGETGTEEREPRGLQERARERMNK
jgi:hypothetical protein